MINAFLGFFVLIERQLVTQTETLSFVIIVLITMQSTIIYECQCS